MPTSLKILDLRTPRQWRAWLEQNHAKSPGIWLTFHKAHTSIQSITYEDSVRDALCFGWIDSLVKRLDDDRYLRKFTPRKPTSKWSDINRKRWSELDADGLLAEPGRAFAPTEGKHRPPPASLGVPAYFDKALSSNPKAFKFFHQLAPTYRRHFVMWVDAAVRPETRAKRIRESLVLLAAGKKLGLK